MQEIVVLTSKLTTQLGIILTNKGDHLFNSFGISRASVNKWVSIYLSDGLEGLYEEPRSARPHFLTKAQQKQLTIYIKENACKPGGGRLVGSDVHSYIEKEFNQHYHPDYIYTLIKDLGFSWITSRSRHPKLSRVMKFKRILKKIKIKTILYQLDSLCPN